LQTSIRISRLFTLLLMICLSASWAVAQFTLSGVAIPGVGSFIDASQYPVISVRFRATKGGQPVTLVSKDVYILEVNKYRNPATLTQESSGIYTATFATSIYNPQTNSRPTTVSGAISVTAMSGPDVASLKASWDFAPNRGASIGVNDDNGSRVPLYLDYGDVIFDKTKELSLRVAETTRDASGSERSVRLESVTTRTGAFSVSWLGTSGTSRPPTNLVSGTAYRFNVTCSPNSLGPISDVLTLVYEGGSRLEILLNANTPSYDPASLLKLIRPNGGEHFSPCQKVPISWSGSLQGFYSQVEFSTDNGGSWSLIDSTLDSAVVWTVPSMYSNDTRIRVHQKQGASGARWLRDERSPASALAFDASGKFLVVAYESGVILEWDVVSGTVTNRYTAAGVAEPTSLISGLTFVGGTREVIAVLDRKNAANDQLQKFSPGQAGPVGTLDVPIGNVVRVATDSTGTRAYVVGSPASVASVYAVASLTPLQSIALTAPSSAASVEKNTLSISQIDGDVVQYSMASSLELRRFKTGLPQAGLAATRNMTVSRTTRLLALAGSADSGSLNTPEEQRTVLFDTKTNSVIRVFYRTGSNSVGSNINANETFLTLGFPGSPQIFQYDISKRIVLVSGGSTPSHSNVMTGIEYGPDGSTLATCSRDVVDNVLIRRISTPDSDISDSSFSISRVNLEYSTISMGNRYIGTKADTIITGQICNRGLTPAIFDEGALLQNKWLTLLDSIDKDTVGPGECLTVRFTVAPLDSGMLHDTLSLRACDERFNIPFTLRSVDRSITMFGDLTDFGDICVGDTVAKTFTLLRNDDPIDVTIDGITMRRGIASSFRVRNLLPGTVVSPGASLDVEFLFVPSKLGRDTDVVEISYAGQISVIRSIRLIGQGSGADVRLSHDTLAFVPEITERDVVISNRSQNDVVLTSAILPAGAPFTFLSSVPLTISANDSVTIRIRHGGGPISGADVLALDFTPCASVVGIGLVGYVGSSIVTAPRVTADPHGNVAIPIQAITTEVVKYNGDRTFEGVLRVNPRLFLAQSITSDVGTAEIVSQEIVGSLRNVRFRIVGSFASTQEIALLTGPAGLAEIDSSILDFDTTATSYGAAVSVVYQPGLLTIANPDPNRHIIHPTSFAIVGVWPQPASSDVTIDVVAEREEVGVVTVVNAQGLVLVSKQVRCVQGQHSMNLSLWDVPSGVHLVVLSAGVAVTSIPVVVLR